ncbi:hypothetical protein JCM10207_005145 [Rhodosporidiobolus poonsookiae]
MNSLRHRPVPSSDDDDSSSDGGDSDDSQGSSSTSSGGSKSSDTDEGSEEEDASDDEEREDDGRKKNSTAIVVALIALAVIAIGVAAYLALSSSSSSSSSAMDSTGTTASGHTSSTSKSSSGSGGGSGGESESAGNGGGTATKTSATKDHTGGASTEPSGATDTAATATSTGGGDGDASTSTSSPSSTSSSGSGNKTGKKGVGYNKVEYTLNLDISWAYSWASTAGGSLNDGVEFVPMLWGEKSLSDWTTNADAALAAGSEHILGMNEPDLAEQANMDPESAASFWKTNIEPYADKAKLISPAVSNGVKTDDGKPMGVPWMLEFLDSCSDCHIDAIALHWYEAASNTDYFTSYLEDACNQLQKPIWLTEFMGTGSANDQKTFIEFAVPWLEQQDFIERYAAFGDFSDNDIANFVDSSGILNDLGTAYSETT